MPRFEELRDAAGARSGAGRVDRRRADLPPRSRSARAAATTWPRRLRAQRDRRRRLFALAAEHGVALGATGTHPWSDYREQQIIETEHYRRVEDGLKYVAWRNNTFSLHVHVGIQGADRAVLVCDRLRPVLPLLLAISANSPFLDGRDSGPAQRPHADRSPRASRAAACPTRSGAGTRSREYIDFLVRTRSIVEYTQVWWSVRPHFAFGTVEVRICDAQSTAAESEALAALIVACVAQAARDIDAGVPFEDLPGRLIEENVWRAVRYGLDGELLDLERGEPYPAGETLERLLAWTAPACAELGIEVALPTATAPSASARWSTAGLGLPEIYASTVGPDPRHVCWVSWEAPRR